ncbi:MAG: hypothetical protein ABMA02_16185, partial [Saprospiraceae bacterium]
NLEESAPAQPHLQPHPEGGEHALGKGKAFDSEYESILSQEQPTTRDVPPSPPWEGPEVGLRRGALFQVFPKNDQWHAVVNALYPSGGKMFARWLHLFPQAASTWLNEPGRAIPFPWQGFFNANYQPATAVSTLAVPGGRVRVCTGGREYLLGNVEVAQVHGSLVLRDRATGQPLTLTDLGLEAPDTRPPVMHLLWLLGVPYVSVEALLPEDGGWQELNTGIWQRPRQGNNNVVMARAAWAVEQEHWGEWLDADKPEAVFFQKMHTALGNLGVPRHLLANLAGQQAQYFDRDSPLSMLLFKKMLRQGTGILRLTEFLPVPNGVAQEFAVDSIIADP